MRVDPARLDATPCAPAQTGPLLGRAVVACRECGGPHAPARAGVEFCSGDCRRLWNNRRAVRGAEIYDLIMAWRYERGRGKALRLWRMVCRLAAEYRRQDRETRAGRASWQDPGKVLEARPWLHADVLTDNITGRRK